MGAIGRYRVVGPLGQGGMGEVFLAYDPTLERDVALKLLHRDTPSGLRDEAKALAALRHPGIVTIFEIGEHGGHDFIAMEYLPGRSLRALLDAGKTPRAELLAVFAKVAHAVAAAHRAGILHRDIKPENIVVAETGEVKVVDFGLARRLVPAPPRRPRAVSARDVADALSGLAVEMADTIPASTGINPITQTAFGTPAYMAPELLYGEPSSVASDTYSLGVVLHECIAGRRPYAASSLVDMVIAVMEGTPPPVLDDPLGPLIARMLARKPARRPSLGTVAAALSLPAPRPRPWWPIAAAGGLAGIAVPVAVVATERRAPPAPVSAAIAIRPIPVTMPSYGDEAPHNDVTADLIAITVQRASGAKLTALAGSATEQADYVVTGRIDETAGQLHGQLELARKSGEKLAMLVQDRPSKDFPGLIDALAVDLAHAIAPGATLEPVPDPARAATLCLKGTQLIEDAQLDASRPYFEQAVDADPSSFDARYGLAIATSWADPSATHTLEVVDQAVAHAPRGPEHELVHGLALMLRGRFGEARAVWQPLEREFAVDTARHPHLMYFLGEANWHDGLHDRGAAYFRRALERKKAFRLPAIHLWQYALARRDVGDGRYYAGLLNEDIQQVELSIGNYAQLATSGHHPYDIQALLVLGQPLPRDFEEELSKDPDADAYAIARALVAGDRAHAGVVFERTLQRANPAPIWSEYIAEVLIAGGMEPETRRLLPILAARSTRGQQHRLEIMAAMAFHDALLIPTDPLRARDARLRDAARAELAGDRAQAAAILAELVADPSFSWDYLERAALLRDLRALHRWKAADALCADTSRPAIVRAVFLVVIRACRGVTSEAGR